MAKQLVRRQHCFIEAYFAASCDPFSVRSVRLREDRLFVRSIANVTFLVRLRLLRICLPRGITNLRVEYIARNFAWGWRTDHTYLHTLTFPTTHVAAL